MKVTILDTITGARKEFDMEYNEYWWCEGNGSCDCNRALFMLGGQHDPLPGVCLGCHRYLIVATDSVMPLHDLNAGYPDALLKEHGLLRPIRGER